MKYSFIILAVSFTLLNGCQSSAPEITRPNVIIIMSDDQGNNLGCLGNPWLKHHILISLALNLFI